ncbi:unnamed protein product, partial [marine sediment metagenome]
RPEFALVVGTTPATVSRWESGEVQPFSHNYARLEEIEKVVDAIELLRQTRLWGAADERAFRSGVAAPACHSVMAVFIRLCAAIQRRSEPGKWNKPLHTQILDHIYWTTFDTPFEVTVDPLDEPTAKATLGTNRAGAPVWFVKVCPVCGKPHDFTELGISTTPAKCWQKHRQPVFVATNEPHRFTDAKKEFRHRQKASTEAEVES